ncbi:AUGMIN subunit 3, variant 2 [Salvia divinorum]|uniref:AUGMIN subunit 3, variant 2 n=1 Tax=Salvia divinorum TaxID=28513 RepID=A0ABD1GLT4_SALDI
MVSRIASLNDSSNRCISLSCGDEAITGARMMELIPLGMTSFYKMGSFWREKIWTLLMTEFQHFQPGETTKRLFLEVKKD